ncbi:hypothetical protein JCM9279_007395 [Rhodotorula babjevae]
MQAADDTSNDYPSFGLSLDTPSKFLQGGTPPSWSIDGAITPSLFGSLDAGRGMTPSFSGTVASGSRETNPFELTLGGAAGKRHSTTATGAFDDGKGAGSKGAPHQFDLLASHTPLGGRKRALSSPAICTPGGSSLNFLLPTSHASSIPNLHNFALQPLQKRPRIDSLASSALSLTDKVFSGTERESDDSPASSVADTPPASSAFPSGAGAKSPQRERRASDIAVGSSSFGAPGAMGPAPPASAFSLLSQLEQQRSAMIAAGKATLSQSMPLPMGPGALDITVKAEAVDESLVSAQPTVTRGVSKKGKAPAVSFASLDGAASEEGTPAPTTKRKGGRKKTSPNKEGEGVELKEGEEEDEESLKRRQFLERNRVAACKSRQKKKEKTAAMERLATDLCNRNHVLQQTALALRQEALTLRQLMHAHQNCSCEHAQGYIARDRQGGGIATIDQLAGRTLHLDYSVPPSMGTDDDVYSFLERPGAGAHPAPSRAVYTGAQLPGAAIPIITKAVPARSLSPAVKRPTTAASSSTTNDLLTRSMMTRRAAAVASGSMGSDIAPALVPAPMPPTMDLSDADFAGLERLDMAAALEASFDRTAPVSAVDPSTQAILDMPLAKHLRSSSAPPTTPGWDSAAPSGDYFAPKTIATHV